MFFIQHTTANLHVSAVMLYVRSIHYSYLQKEISDVDGDFDGDLAQGQLMVIGYDLPWLLFLFL